MEPNLDGGVLEASFSPDAQFVIAGTSTLTEKYGVAALSEVLSRRLAICYKWDASSLYSFGIEL